MATKQNILDAIRDLQGARLRGGPTAAELPAMVDMWSNELDICLPEYLKDGVKMIIRNSKFFPTINEMLVAHDQAMLESIELRYGVGNANRSGSNHKHPLTKAEINKWHEIFRKQGYEDEFIDEEILRGNRR